MSLGESIETCLRNYATFSGRARRAEYWYFVLFLVLARIALGIVDSVAGTDFGGPVGPGSVGVFGLVFSLATFLPWLAVAVRRLHDIDFRGWWMLLSLTVIGGIPLFVMLCRRGSQGENRFGPPPS